MNRELRQAAVVAASTVVWTALAVITFDQLPPEWFRSTAASFAPVTGNSAAVYFLPIAIVILFVAGWMGTLGLIFAIMGWRIRDEEAPGPPREDAQPDLQGGGSTSVQEQSDSLR